MKRLIVIVLIVFFSISIYATNSVKIKLVNIGGTAIMTLMRGIMEGKVKSFKDVIRTLFYGGIGGYGFYQSKKLISNGKIFSGVLLANISTSMIENIASGKHPFSRIGYSFGFMRMNVSFKRINFDISPLDVLSFLGSLKYSSKIIFKNGVISFKLKKKYDDSIGWSMGMFPSVLKNADGHTYKHEIIHIVQNLQLIGLSCEPFFDKEKSSLFEIRTQFTGLVFRKVNNLFSYRNNIKEIEAFYFIKCQHGFALGFK